MASESGNSIDEGRLDLVPMIDCIMLLLLFFILTTRFTSEELRIAAVLPQGGPVVPSRPVVLPPPTVRIAVLPDGAGGTMVRIGGGEPLRLSQEDLRLPGGPVLDAVVDDFHRQIATRLAIYEVPGVRAGQVPIEIHCATRMPWCAALAVYDAVRGYESKLLPRRDLPIEEQRPVAFAAPVLRGTRTDNERDELDRLLRLR